MLTYQPVATFLVVAVAAPLPAHGRRARVAAFGIGRVVGALAPHNFVDRMAMLVPADAPR